MIKLTYGFCSLELAKEIPGRIAPKLDQHASHEKKRSGKFICERLGAACDFIVEDEDMEEVANWVSENTNFDRVYFYDSGKPIHVSWFLESSRQMTRMVLSQNKRMVPRTTSK